MTPTPDTDDGRVELPPERERPARTPPPQPERREPPRESDDERDDDKRGTP